MTYYINGEEKTEIEFKSFLMDQISRYYTEDFDVLLDEVYGTIEISDIEYYASQILLNVDPIAYEINLDNYLNEIYEDKLFDIECGESIIIEDYTFEREL